MPRSGTSGRIPQRVPGDWHRPRISSIIAVVDVGAVGDSNWRVPMNPPGEFANRDRDG